MLWELDLEDPTWPMLGNVDEFCVDAQCELDNGVAPTGQILATQLFQTEGVVVDRQES
jgi:hypothetical protein